VRHAVDTQKAAVVALDDVDKQQGGFGHTLCAEKPYGPTNNALMLTRQIAITQKVGKHNTVPTAIYAEKGTSKLKASFSGGPMLNQTASEWADVRRRLGDSGMNA